MSTALALKPISSAQNQFKAGVEHLIHSLFKPELVETTKGGLAISATPDENIIMIELSGRARDPLAKLHAYAEQYVALGRELSKRSKGRVGFSDLIVSEERCCIFAEKRGDNKGIQPGDSGIFLSMADQAAAVASTTGLIVKPFDFAKVGTAIQNLQERAHDLGETVTLRIGALFSQLSKSLKKS